MFIADAPAGATDYVVFKIFNETKVPITAIYDKRTGDAGWGINDLADLSGTANPYAAPVRPVQPGHFFYIRFQENTYSHCPGILRDVKLVFANGAVKSASGIDVCKYDLHVNHL